MVLFGECATPLSVYEFSCECSSCLNDDTCGHGLHVYVGYCVFVLELFGLMHLWLIWFNMCCVVVFIGVVLNYLNVFIILGSYSYNVFNVLTCVIVVVLCVYG